MNSNKVEIKEKYEQTIFYTAAVIGGVFAGYTLSATGILGTAQTSNLIGIIVRLADGDMSAAVLCACGVLIYAAAIILTRVIKSFSRTDIRLVSLAVSAVCAVVMLLLPHEIEPMIALYPSFFAMAFQWNSFPGAYGYASSCIFSSNNFRQMTDGAAEYFCTKNAEAGRKSLFYAGTLLFFHIGAAAAVLCWRNLGEKTMLICLPLLVLIEVEIMLQKRYLKSASNEL